MMKAIVYEAAGAPARWQTFPEPVPADDGAVVEVRATGICRSDWHAWRGHEEVPLPHVPGHEFAGIVAAVGSQVRSFAVGDRVTAPFVNGCGRCTWCRDGYAQICPDQSQPGFTHPGSYAEQVGVRAADLNLVRLPEAIDFVSAAALGCRFATAFRALTGHRTIEAGQWVAVFGCGGVGLSAVMIARALGARVIAVDLSPAALGAATALGAEVTIADRDPVYAVREASGGGVHVGIDALGAPATSAASIRSLRRRGLHVQVGLLIDADAYAGAPWDVIVSHELQVVGSHGMAARDYPAMLAMIADGRLPVDRLVGQVIPLEQAGTAMMAMDSMVATRAGLTVATR